MPKKKIRLRCLKTLSRNEISRSWSSRQKSRRLRWRKPSREAWWIKCSPKFLKILRQLRSKFWRKKNKNLFKQSKTTKKNLLQKNKCSSSLRRSSKRTLKKLSVRRSRRLRLNLIAWTWFWSRRRKLQLIQRCKLKRLRNQLWKNNPSCKRNLTRQMRREIYFLLRIKPILVILLRTSRNKWRSFRVWLTSRNLGKEKLTKKIPCN